MVEQRTENSRLGMPTCAVRYKLEPLCQLPEPRFEAKVPFGDILSFLVRRLFVAKTKGAFEGQRGEFLGSAFTSWVESVVTGIPTIAPDSSSSPTSLPISSSRS